MATRFGTPVRPCLPRGLFGWIAGAMVLLGQTQLAGGQEVTRLRFRVPPTILAEPARETAIAIAVEPADLVPNNSFVRIRGLPATVAISDGHSVGPGAWAVPLRALPDLTLTAPADVPARSVVTFMLIALDGTVLAEAKADLIVAPAAAAVSVEPKPAPPTVAATLAPAVIEPPPPPVPVPALPPKRSVMPVSPSPVPSVLPPPASAAITTADRQRLERMIERGDSELADGNVAAARLLYRRAADGGLAQGALALGATYDGAELARRRVIGIQPDPASARVWYEKAAALGSVQAAELLARLSAR